jgi:electron transfer flavoprotein beta subunit
MMKIAVNIKTIPDPEIPPAKFRLDEKAMQVIPPEGIPPVMSPYDEQAVELALRLKDQHDCQVTVLSVTSDPASAILRQALAMGADEAIALSDNSFEGSDSFGTASILAKAIQKIDNCDLILCGRQAADWDEGLVGAILAEKLGTPLISLAYQMDLVNGQLQVRRTIRDGYQVFSVPFPAVVTVSSEVGKPRLPSGWGIIAASQKQIIHWNAEAMGIDPAQVGPGAARRKLAELYVPLKGRECQISSGLTTAEAAAKLAESLIKAGIIREISVGGKE